MFTQIGIIESQLDYDAINFCSAAGITNQTQVLAIHYLVSNMKLKGLWAKCKAIYPFIGGTASTHKWNLKDPRDLDAAFRLVFSGTWTHSANGATPDGNTAFADTKLNASTNINTTDLCHNSYYSRTTTQCASEMVMGVSDGTGFTGLSCRRNSPTDQARFVFDCGAGTSLYGIGAGTTTDGSGFFIGSIIYSDIYVYRNGTALTLTKTGNRNIAIQNATFFIGAINAAGLPSNFTDKQCAFASIGNGLTTTEMSDFNTIVAQYQTILGR